MIHVELGALHHDPCAKTGVIHIYSMIHVLKARECKRIRHTTYHDDHLKP